MAILLTTHYMSEAESCDHIVLMFAGRVVADAKPEELEQELEAEVGELLEFTTSNPPGGAGTGHTGLSRGHPVRQ